MTVPTVPDIEPSPILPDLGVEIVVYIALNFWSYCERKTVGTPAIVAVTQTDVGHADEVVVTAISVDVEDFVVVTALAFKISPENVVVAVKEAAAWMFPSRTAGFAENKR